MHSSGLRMLFGGSRSKDKKRPLENGRQNRGAGPIKRQRKLEGSKPSSSRIGSERSSRKKKKGPWSKKQDRLNICAMDWDAVALIEQ